MEQRVVWTSVFADGPGGGNPCPVVFGADEQSDEELQAQAVGFGAETVFVLPQQSGGDVRLRYFVPGHEMEMCVHATIAASVLLGHAGDLPQGRATVETPLGTLGVTWSAAAAVVDQFAPVFGAEVTDVSRIASALRIAAGAIGGPVRSVSASRPKLIVPLPSEAVLDSLVPDFELLWQVCDELNVTGFYPFAPGVDGADVSARQFPRRAGYVEDPATGVAAAALAAYLALVLPSPGWHTWRIAQGRAMGRPSVLFAEAHVDGSSTVTATRVGGTARRQQRDERRL
ncbi:MAG: PhzF family phenazine biosynthesis protein [Jatrophihabitantaceae bacterium]